jgi:hypothetical protein
VQLGWGEGRSRPWRDRCYSASGGSARNVDVTKGAFHDHWAGGQYPVAGDDETACISYPHSGCRSALCTSHITVGDIVGTGDSRSALASSEWRGAGGH